TPAAAPPAKRDRPRSCADGDTMSNDVVLRQLLCRQAMPLDDDAAPSQWDATQNNTDAAGAGVNGSPFVTSTSLMLLACGALIVSPPVEAHGSETKVTGPALLYP